MTDEETPRIQRETGELPLLLRQSGGLCTRLLFLADYMDAAALLPGAKCLGSPCTSHMTDRVVSPVRVACLPAGGAAISDSFHISTDVWTGEITP